MKKVVFIAALALSTLAASAQTEKGKILVGGTLDFTTSKSKADGAEASNNFTIMPIGGYFVNDNLALGTGIGYQFNENAGGKNEAIMIQPFGRYYKGISDQFKFYGQLSVPLSFGTSKDGNGDKIGNTNSVGVSLSPGFAFFPAKKFGIELGFSGISFTDVTVKNSNGDKVDAASYSTFQIGANFLSPRLGFAFYL